MRKHPKNIVSYFADIFNFSLDEEGNFDLRRYFQLRDDFYQLVRSSLKTGKDSPEDVSKRFEPAPKIDNPILASFAAGNAEYYSRILGIDSPDWAKDTPPIPEYEQPHFPFVHILHDLQKVIDSTPPELRKRGFVYSEHNFEIY